jgi:hypothetical protein
MPKRAIPLQIANPAPIDDHAHQIVRDARAYMRKHGLTNHAMAQICGISEFLLRRRGGIMSDEWTCGLDTLGALERGVRDFPDPPKPRGRAAIPGRDPFPQQTGPDPFEAPTQKKAPKK